MSVKRNLKTLWKPARKFWSKPERKFGQISTVILLRLWVNLWKENWGICKKLDKMSIKDWGTVEKTQQKFKKKINFE